MNSIVGSSSKTTRTSKKLSSHLHCHHHLPLQSLKSHLRLFLRSSSPTAYYLHPSTQTSLLPHLSMLLLLPLLPLHLRIQIRTQDHRFQSSEGNPNQVQACVRACFFLIPVHPPLDLCTSAHLPFHKVSFHCKPLYQNGARHHVRTSRYAYLEHERSWRNDIPQDSL